MAAAASIWCAAQAEGTTPDAERLREALASFAGVKRRFEFYVNTPKQVYMDDYAHHPRELAVLQVFHGIIHFFRIQACDQFQMFGIILPGNSAEMEVRGHNNGQTDGQI